MPGVLLTFLQLFFALTWVVYVIYLPSLAQEVGIARKYVPMILILDQVIFLACDWAAGVYADRVARRFGRIGGPMAGVALVSCAAFVALPYVAPMASPAVFLFLTILWSMTSSALRAPSLAIVSRQSSAPGQPWIACAYLFGLGLASAAAPYIAQDLRQMDPRIPFVTSTVGLALFAIALARAERAPTPLAPAGLEAPAAKPPPSIVLLAVVILLFASGFQVHFAVNSASSYLRFSSEEHLPKLMPIFWVGFNIGLLPATLLVKRFGGSAMLVVAGVIGVAALTVCARAPTLTALVFAQGFAGLAWCFALTAAFSAALAAGRPGREGLLTGILFSTLAAAAILRLGIIASGLPTGSTAAAALENIPFIAWALAAFLMAMVAFPEREKASARAR